MRKRLGAVTCALVSLLLGGCATSPGLSPELAARPGFAELANQPSVLDVYDPLEGLNRGVYKFNAVFDRYLFLPAVRAYEIVTPEFVQERISDFFSNLTEPFSFANSLLQGKGARAGRAATRFIVNTMFTAGFFDLAGARGVEQEREDFGQTLGVWGVDKGPYLVLPVFGPSNFRDAAGLGATGATYFFAVPTGVSGSIPYKLTTYVLWPIDTRHQIKFRYYETGSPFEYELVRLIYTEKRELDIAN
ncbi:MAG: MlaA family lipoprotein [Geminicoccaceae bacterium]